MRRFLANSRAFTLLELLVAAGLIAALSVVVLGVMNGGRGSALQAGQAAFADLLVAARTQAAASNQPVRLLVNFNPADPELPSRFLRYVVLQVQTRSGWQSRVAAYLPPGVYILPGRGPAPHGLFASASSGWLKVDGSDLRSTTFRTADAIDEAIDDGPVERWLVLPISANGTTNAAGDIVLANGRTRAPGSFAAGESPVELLHPDEVRGLALSQYGVATAIDRRTSF
jgi:type II secretory pathway pseudopilin PulG